MRWPPLLLIALLASPVGAHPGDEYDTLTAETEDVTFYVTPQTPVVKAQRDVILMGEAASLREGRYGAVTDGVWALRAEGPGEALVEVQPYGGGFVSKANFSAPGEWVLQVSVNGTSAEIPIRVYPATSVRAASDALRYDLFYVGRETKASLHFVDDATGSLVRGEGEVVARVERWENGTMEAVENVTLQRGRSAGEYRFVHTFQEEGSYLIRVASAEHGIGSDDLPPFKVNVLSARIAEAEAEGAREMPVGAAVGLLACLFAVAFVRRRA